MAESACVALAVSRPSLRRTTMRRSVGCGGAETKTRTAAGAAAKMAVRRSGGAGVRKRRGAGGFVGRGEREFGLLADLQAGDARARAEVGEDSERGLALRVDDVARAAGA